MYNYNGIVSLIISLHPCHLFLLHFLFSSRLISHLSPASFCLLDFFRPPFPLAVTPPSKRAQDFPPNTVIASLTGLTSGPKAYSSVQYGPGPSDHFELNSDLLFINHSCKPNVGFDLSAPRTSTADYPREWHIKTLARGLQAGDALTFFYPSTEWDMQQGFNCQCGEKECLGMIKGAKHLKREQLDAQEWINPHILKLKDEQRGLTKE